MKTTILAALAAAAAIGLPGSASAADAGPAATVTAFITAFNKGDAKAAAATHVADPVIVDEPAPHLWRGAGAFQAWAADLGKESQAKGRSEEGVTLGAVKRQEVDGDMAYLIMAADYHFLEKGRPFHEPSQMTFALKKTADGWKIAAWTWTGPRQQPVAKK
jgi:ketosteroid isomerase-like protein